MADNQTTVVYKAIADFSALSRAARKAKKDLRDLRNEEAALNAQSVASSNAATAAAGKQAKGREQLVKQFESEAGATRRAAAATQNVPHPSARYLQGVDRRDRNGARRQRYDQCS